MSNSTVYDINDIATVGVTFKVDGNLTDPSGISATFAKPDRSTSTYSLSDFTRDSLGAYHLNIQVDQPGDWTFKIAGTGAATDTGQGGFYVRPDATQNYGRDLCSLTDVYGFMPGFTADEDGNAATVTKIAAEITARSRSIHQTTSREFVAIANQDARPFDLTRSICQRRTLAIGDAAAIDQLELFDTDGTTSLGIIDPSLYITVPRILEEWEPIRRIKFPYRPSSALMISPGRTLVVTGTWGFPVIPADIREACAALVVTTMLTDVAQAGTDLSDAVDPTLNISGLIRYSLDTIASYSDGGFA